MTLHLNNLVLNERQICDLELLLSGAFQPLESFMVQKDYESVIKNMRLSTGDLWPMPITLDITETIKKDYDLQIDSEVALRDHEGFLIATLTITDIWKIDKEKEVFVMCHTGTRSQSVVKWLKSKGYNNAVNVLGGIDAWAALIDRTIRRY